MDQCLMIHLDVAFLKSNGALSIKRENLFLQQLKYLLILPIRHFEHV